MKYSGIIGFSLGTTETAPGVWKPTYAEHRMTGDLLTVRQNNQNNSSINDQLTMSNQISIVADAFTYQNMTNIKYATFMGQTYKISSIEDLRPRLRLTLGSVYTHEKGSVTNEV